MTSIPAPKSRARSRPALPPPAELVAAPGFGARRLYQAYLAAWVRHVDSTLTGPQFAVLSAIRAYPHQDQTSLANAVSLDTSTMADVCRRLETRGLITRRESTLDARAKVLALTDQGTGVLSSVEARTRALDEALLSRASVEDRTRVAHLLDELAGYWEAVAHKDTLQS